MPDAAIGCLHMVAGDFGDTAKVGVAFIRTGLAPLGLLHGGSAK